MSLVITTWNESMGIAVSEGRVGKWVDGKYVPTDENRSKLARLPNGCVLGIAGHSRKGFPAYASLLDVFEGLRSAIVLVARSTGFRELSVIIPALLDECSRKHPELFYCVTLIGNDNGTVRGAAFDSDGKKNLPTARGVTWQILSPSAELSREVDVAMRTALKPIGLRDAGVAGKVLENIIRTFATRYPDINGNTFIETISASCPGIGLSMNADNITTGTLDATQVVFSDGSSLNTASRVLTSTSTISSAVIASSTTTWVSTGLGFTTTVESATDALNFFASLVLTVPGGTLQPVAVGIFEDVTLIFETQLNGMSTSTQVAQAFFASLVDVGIGAHQFEIFLKLTTGGSTSVTLQPSANGTYCICQRVF